MMQDDANTIDRLEQAERLKLEGKHAEAIAILEALVLEDPENVAALEEIADNELSLCNFERAEAAARRAVNISKESYTGEYIIGFLHSRSGQWKDACAHLRSANRLKSNNPEILRCLGWALFSNGEETMGMVTLERALNLEPESALTLCDLGLAHLQLKNLKKAKVLFERALDLEPNNTRAKECLDAAEKLLAMNAEKKVRS